MLEAVPSVSQVGQPLPTTTSLNEPAFSAVETPAAQLSKGVFTPIGSVSRRTVIAGLAGVAVGCAVGGGLVLLADSQKTPTTPPSTIRFGTTLPYFSGPNSWAWFSALT